MVDDDVGAHATCSCVSASLTGGGQQATVGAGQPRAAIFGEIGHQPVHRGIVGRIDDKAALAALRYQPGIGQGRQMKAHRGETTPVFRRWRLRAGHRPGLHQQAESGQAVFLCQRAQRADDGGCVHLDLHDSINIEIWRSTPGVNPARALFRLLAAAP
jgi:hypothetical protein